MATRPLFRAEATDADTRGLHQGALLFFDVQASVLIGVILAIRWNARRKDRLERR